MQPPINLIGQTLKDRYQVTEILGQGGMSAVYKAFDPTLQRIVAIKTIHSHLAHDPKFVIRFQEEATAVARLRHPNIVQVYDFIRDQQDFYYMVQEFIAGETLQERLKRLNKTERQMPVAEVCRYSLQVCNALEYAHQRGLIHRDVKPANIMLDVNGEAILMDFGIVKIVGGQSHTASGAVIGTALYMPPEMIRGENPGPRSDMYSLGIAIFEMVSGHPPYEAESAMALMMMHLNEPVPDLRTLRPSVPGELIAIISKAVAKDPANRFSSMGEMAAALRQLTSRLETDGSDVMIASSPVTSDTPFSPTIATPSSSAYIATPSAASAVSPIQAGGQTPPPSSGRNYESQPAPQFGMQGSGPPLTGQAIPAPVSGRQPVLWLILAGAALILIAVVCAILAILPNIPGRESLPTEAAALVTTPELVVQTQETSKTPTLSPSDTPVLTPTPSPLPTETPTPTLSPTPTIPIGVPFSRIHHISQDEAGQYLVEYETFEFTESLNGLHLVFYFDTQPTDLGYMYGGPRPFAKFNPAQRPAESGKICIAVSNVDHTVRENSGNCVPAPDVVVAFANIDLACQLGPGEEFDQVSLISAGESALVRGISPDETWWSVVDPQNISQSCWLPIRDTLISGDISSLPLADPPQLTPLADDSLSVQITEITLDDQGRFIVSYVTQNFREQLPGTHLHFFFNNVSADQVGIEGEGNRLMFGGPSPFTGFNAQNRPASATQICVLVANPNHSVIPGSGNCLDLPANAHGHPTPQTNDEPKEPRDPPNYDY